MVSRSQKFENFTESTTIGRTWPVSVRYIHGHGTWDASSLDVHSSFGKLAHLTRLLNDGSLTEHPGHRDIPDSLVRRDPVWRHLC